MIEHAFYLFQTTTVFFTTAMEIYMDTSRDAAMASMFGVRLTKSWQFQWQNTVTSWLRNIFRGRTASCLYLICMSATYPRLKFERSHRYHNFISQFNFCNLSLGICLPLVRFLEWNRNSNRYRHYRNCILFTKYSFDNTVIINLKLVLTRETVIIELKPVLSR